MGGLHFGLHQSDRTTLLLGCEWSSVERDDSTSGRRVEIYLMAEVDKTALPTRRADARHKLHVLRCESEER